MVVRDRYTYYVYNDIDYLIVFVACAFVVDAVRKIEDFVGDANGDSQLDISDIVYIVNEILSYNANTLLCICDKNHDQNIDLLDIILLINSII